MGVPGRSRQCMELRCTSCAMPSWACDGWTDSGSSVRSQTLIPLRNESESRTKERILWIHLHHSRDGRRLVIEQRRSVDWATDQWVIMGPFTRVILDSGLCPAVKYRPMLCFYGPRWTHVSGHAAMQLQIESNPIASWHSHDQMWLKYGGEAPAISKAKEMHMES